MNNPCILSTVGELSYIYSFLMQFWNNWKTDSPLQTECGYSKQSTGLLSTTRRAKFFYSELIEKTFLTYPVSTRNIFKVLPKLILTGTGQNNFWYFWKTNRK